MPRFPVPGMGVAGHTRRGDAEPASQSDSVEPPRAPAALRPRGPTGWRMAVGAESKLSFDSKMFESKIAQEVRNQFDRGKTGATWKTLTRGYLISRCHMAKYLLQWAEDFKKDRITPEHVYALTPFMGENPLVIDHHLWAFFNLNLTGMAERYFATSVILKDLKYGGESA